MFTLCPFQKLDFKEHGKLSAVNQQVHTALYEFICKQVGRICDDRVIFASPPPREKIRFDCSWISAIHNINTCHITRRVTTLYHIRNVSRTNAWFQNLFPGKPMLIKELSCRFRRSSVIVLFHPLMLPVSASYIRSCYHIVPLSGSKKRGDQGNYLWFP